MICDTYFKKALYFHISLNETRVKEITGAQDVSRVIDC